MIFSNIFYFFSAVVVISFSNNKSSFIDFPVNLMWIIVLTILFFNYNRYSFRRLRIKYNTNKNYTDMKNDLDKVVNRGLFLALIIFTISVILFDLKYLLARLPVLNKTDGLTDILLILYFMFLLSFVWNWSFKYFFDVYTLGNSAKEHIFSNIRFNLAIIIPWVIIVVINDIVSLLNLTNLRTMYDGVLGQIFVIMFYFTVFVLFTPFMVTKIWESEPLKDRDAREMIISYCKRESVRFREILSWKILNGSMLTAAVIGFIYPFRYLLLTPRLTDLLNKDEMLAVVSHEVGHIKKKHIFFYILFFLASMPILISFSTYIVSMIQITEPGRSIFIMFYDPNNLFINILMVVFTLFFFILFFRYFFGFLMRNFERQADLYCFESDVNPEYLISAFEKLNTVIKEPKNSKNWHHFNISERVGFLKKCISDPTEIKKHNKKVKKTVMIMGISVLLVLTLSFNFIFKANFISEKESLLLNIDIVKTMLEKNPYNFKLYANYGMLNYMAEEWSEAIKGFKTSLEIEPNQPDVLNNLAWLLLTCKDKRYLNKIEALQYAKSALNIVKVQNNFDYAYILDTLAEAYYQNGLFKKAFKAAKRAKDMSRNNKEHYKKQYEKMKKASIGSSSLGTELI